MRFTMTHKTGDEMEFLEDTLILDDHEDNGGGHCEACDLPFPCIRYALAKAITFRCTKTSTVMEIPDEPELLAELHTDLIYWGDPSGGWVEECRHRIRPFQRIAGQIAAFLESRGFIFDPRGLGTWSAPAEAWEGPAR